MNDKQVLDSRPSVAQEQDAVWRQFAAATSIDSYCYSWLTLLCQNIEGVAAAVVLVATEEKRPFAPVAFWPDRDRDLKHLAQIAERAIVERRGLVSKRSPAVADSSDVRYDIAYPIQASGRTYAVVALDVDARPEEALRAILRQLQWASGWMEVLCYRREAHQEGDAEARIGAVVDLLAVTVAQQNFRGAATGLATALATRFQCDRVSVGFIHRQSVRVEALSHSADFTPETNLLRTIAVAMDEAADQGSGVVLPQAGEGRLITRGHADLARLYGNGSICSVLLKGRSGITGVVTLERTAELPFDGATIDLCESICALAGPILEVQRSDDRWIGRRIVDSVKLQMSRLVGPGHIALKLATVAIPAVLLFFSFATADYRVTAKTIIEPSAKQALVAAFDGYIRTAPLKAGTVVHKKDTLATLDDRDLKLERTKWESQKQQNLKQYYEALGNRNAAEVQILSAQIKQAEAQTALLDEQIARTQVMAPFDGVIVTGDLSQAIGSPVQRGQVLFEIAPLDSYRIILQVDERQIGDVAVGQRGRLVLSGFADQALDFKVGRMTPVSTTTDGRNFFRVEAQLDHVPDRLRPGMEGVGKIDIDRRRLIWVWTHEVTDWIKLNIWSWMP